MWLSRNVRHVCDGGVRRRTRYLETVACEISRPSFWSSPWIRGARHRGLARAMVRISARTSGAMAGRGSGPAALPGPEQPEACPLPPDDGLWLDDGDDPRPGVDAARS